MSDFGFSAKNASGEYLITEETETLTFVKVAINIDSFITGVNSPTLGRKDGFGGFSELVYKITNCAGTPVPFFTTPRNDKVYSVNRIRHAGGSNWYVHIITNARPYHKGTYIFTGNTTLPQTGQFSSTGLGDERSIGRTLAYGNNGLAYNLRTTNIQTTDVGAVYIVPRNFGSSFKQSGIDRGGYVVCKDKSWYDTTLPGNSAVNLGGLFTQQATSPSQRIRFLNLVQSGKEVGYSIPVAGGSSNNDKIFTDTGIYSTFQFNPGDLSHRGDSTYGGSNTTGVPAAGWKWERLGAVRYNFRGVDRTTRSGSPYATTQAGSSASHYENSIEYWAGTVSETGGVTNFSGADTNRTAGSHVITNATSNGGADVVVGTIQATVNSSGEVTEILFEQGLNRNHAVGDTITIPGASLGGGTNFTFDIASIDNRTRIFVTEYGQQNIIVGQYCMFGSMTTWKEVKEKHTLPEVEFTEGGVTFEVEDKYIAIDGNYVLNGYSEDDLAELGSHSAAHIGHLDDPVGTSNGNRKYDEENWMPGGEAWLFGGIYIRGFAPGMSLSLGTSEGGTYTAASTQNNMDFIPLSSYQNYTLNFHDFGTDEPDGTENALESTNPYDSVAHNRYFNFTTYHDAVYGAPETSRSFVPDTRLNSPTYNIDPDAPVTPFQYLKTNTYKAAPYITPSTQSGSGVFTAGGSAPRSTVITLKLPCLYYRALPSGLGFAATKALSKIINKGSESYHRFHTNATASATFGTENQMLWGGRPPQTSRTLSDGTEIDAPDHALASRLAYEFVDVKDVDSVDFSPKNYTKVAGFEFDYYHELQEEAAPNDKVRSFGIASSLSTSYNPGEGEYGTACLMTATADVEDNVLLMLDNPHHIIKSGSGGDDYTNSGPVLMVADLSCSSALALAKVTDFSNPTHYGPQHFHFMKAAQSKGLSDLLPGEYKVTSITSQHTFGGQYHQITTGATSAITATSDATWNVPGSGETHKFKNPLDPLHTVRANINLTGFSSGYPYTTAQANSHSNRLQFHVDPGLTNTNAGLIIPDHSSLIENGVAHDHALVSIRVQGKSWYGEDFSKTVLQRIYPSQSWTDGYGDPQYENVKLYINKGEYCYATDYVNHYLGADVMSNNQLNYNDGYFVQDNNKAVIPLSQKLEQVSPTTPSVYSRHPHISVPGSGSDNSGNSGIPKDYIHGYKMADYNLTQRRFTHRLNTPLFSHKYVNNYFIYKRQDFAWKISNRGGAGGPHFFSTEGQKLVEHGFGMGVTSEPVTSMSNLVSYKGGVLEATKAFFNAENHAFYFESNHRAGGYSVDTMKIDDGNLLGMLGCMDFYVESDNTGVNNVGLHHNNMRPLATICAMDYFGADSATNKCTFTFYEKLNNGSWVQKQDGELPYYNIFVHNPYPIDGTDEEAEDFVEGAAKRHFRVDVHRKSGFPTAKTNAARAYCTLDMTGYSMKTVYLRKFHITSWEEASNSQAWIHSGFTSTPDDIQVVYRCFIPGVKTAFGSIDNIHGFNAQPFYVAESTESTDSNWVTSANAPTSLSDRSWRTTRNQASFSDPATTPGSSVVEKSFGYFPITVAKGENPSTGTTFTSSFLEDTGNTDSLTTIYQSWTDDSVNPYGLATRGSVSATTKWQIRGITPEDDNGEFLQDILTGVERNFVKAERGFLDALGTFTECIIWDGSIVATNASIVNNADNSLPNPSVVGDFTYTYDTTLTALSPDIQYSGVKATGPFLEDDDGVEVFTPSNKFDATNIPRLYIFADPATAPTAHSADTTAVQILKADGSTVAFDSRHRQLQIHDIASASFPATPFTRGVSGLKADSGGGRYTDHSSKFYPDQYTTVSGFTTPTNGAFFFNTKIQRSEVRLFKKTEKKTWNKYYHETRYWANYKAGVQKDATNNFKTGFITVLAGHRYDVAKGRILGGIGEIKLGGKVRKSGGISNYQNATYNSSAETIMSINTDLYTSNSYLVHLRQHSATRLSLDGEDRDGNIDHTKVIFNDDSAADGLQGPTLRFIVGDEIVLGRHSGMEADFTSTTLEGGFELLDKGISWSNARNVEGQQNVPSDTCIYRRNVLGSYGQALKTIWIPDLPGTYWLKLRVTGFDEYVVPITVEQG